MPQEAKNYIPNTLQDGRRKITPEQYPKIKEYYKGVKSQRKTAEHFNISKRLVQFILDPDKLKHLQENNKKNKHHLKYYDTEKRRLYMQKYRAKKREQGLMIIKTKPIKYKDKPYTNIDGQPVNN
jgi:vacuolar-type H+-ATPase subunit I/STV1